GAGAAPRDHWRRVAPGGGVETAGAGVPPPATDRYRLAVRELRWRPADPAVTGTALIPARTLADNKDNLFATVKN
ncbi:MAG: DNA polymerase III subunit beta, partial [Frankia sp.]